MIDREKVIKGLECCIKYPKEYGDCMGGNCPYGTHVECHNKLLQDARTLLKTQEPVEPKMMEFVDEGLTWEKYEVPTCGACGALLGDALFCPMCGKAVKWE